MNYSKLSKSELLNLVKSQEAQLEKQKAQADAQLEKQKAQAADYDKLQQKYQIVADARKEDKDKVEEAERRIAEFSAKEQELSQYYAQQVGHMQKTLNEQNETIISLFDMMDNTINLQLNYYQKFKNVFISIEKKED